MKKILFLATLFISSVISYGQATGYVLPNYATNGSLGSADTTVDANALLNIKQTTPGITITMPTPGNVLAGKNITINNIGTVPFTLLPGGVVMPGNGVIYRWTGNWSVTGAGSIAQTASANTVYAAPSGSTGIPAFRALTSADIPTLSTSKITGLATVATTNSYTDLINKPSIPTNTNQLTNGAGFLITEVDGSVTNEIQTLGLASNILSISGGNTVTLPVGYTFTGSSTQVTTGSGTYITLKKITPYSGVTDASGNYTYTFPVAYAVAPVVQPSIPNQSDKNQNVIVTSVSTTGVTLNVYTRPAITSLPIIGTLAGALLGATTTPVNGQSIDFVVFEK